MEEPQTFNLGESGLLLCWDRPPDPHLSREIVELGQRLARTPPPGLIEWVPGLRSLAVYYDPLRLQRETLAGWLRELCQGIALPDVDPSPPLVVPVRYGGVWGPDLEAVARKSGLESEEVIRLHTEAVFEVVLIGFAPGFPYLAGLPEPLRLPRRTSPRARVAKGSVAVAGAYTGIYPREGPGGWSIIGQTAWEWFDPGDEPPCRLALGDRIRFCVEVQ